MNQLSEKGTILGSSSVDSRRRTIVPPKVAKEMGLNEGDQITWVKSDQKGIYYIISKVTIPSFTPV